MTTSDMSKDEKVGFHKGSLATLSKEREELMRILQIVEQLMQMHIKELKDLGVDLAAQAKGEAIQFVVNRFVEFENEPELKPEFIKKIQEIAKQKSIKVDDFAQRYGVK